MIGGLVLAAGESRRFGAPKQLARLGGRPLLEHAVAAVAAAPVERVVVVLGARAEAILEGVDLHRARAIVCDRWRDGQAEALRAGVQALADAEAIVVVLGDQPLISTDAIERVIRSRRPGSAAVRATYGGGPGHPVLFERAAFRPLMRIRGDVGARSVLLGLDVREVPCDGLGDPVDVDTPDDLRQVEDASG